MAIRLKKLSAEEMEKSSSACGRLFILSSQTMQSCPAWKELETGQNIQLFFMHCVLEIAIETGQKVASLKVYSAKLMCESSNMFFEGDHWSVTGLKLRAY